MSAAVKLHEVIKRFGSVEVLKGVSFDVAPGAPLYQPA
jgi:polar amino acid transport system ATP-binding protein